MSEPLFFHREAVQYSTECLADVDGRAFHRVGHRRDHGTRRAQRGVGGRHDLLTALCLHLLRLAGSNRHLPTAKLRRAVRSFIDEPSAVAGGCPLMNASIDLDDGNGDGNPELRKLALKGNLHWHSELVRS